MKKNCLLCTVFLVFLCSCSTRTIPALSPVQIATIEEEVKGQYVEFNSAVADLALSTQFGRRQNWFEDRARTVEIFHANFLWKKEAEGWKIIHVNDTGFPRDN